MLSDLTVEIYADTADLEEMEEMRQLPYVKGFTTNPTLMRKAETIQYPSFVQEALSVVDGLPISFEVIADDLEEMERQARTLSSWGASNIYVKIPITTTSGESTAPLIGALVQSDIKVNVTAVFTPEQVEPVVAAIGPYGFNAIISVFAGRIANAGVDPCEYMIRASDKMNGCVGAKLLWASPRQIYDVVQANWHADIITITPAMIKGLDTLGKDLTEYSLETVKMFYADAQAAGYSL